MYIERVADGVLRDALRRAGAVVIEGPKACGKTATALQVAASTVEVDTDPNVELLLAIAPELVLDGPIPRLFDEWHIQPALWNLVRRRVDRSQQKGQFILTGSAAPSADLARHSGAGRFARIQMATMSFFESGHSTGTVSLESLVTGKPATAAEAPLALQDLVQRLATGGWPGFLAADPVDALASVRDYLKSLVEVDLPDVAGVRHDPGRVQRLLSSLARGIATEMTISTLATDADLTRDTVRSYLSALARVFALQDQPAWSSHLRSRATLRQEPKRHLTEPSLAVAALEANPRSLMRNLAYVGQLFESQVVHDLRVYSGQTIFHARDTAGAEVDAIIEYPSGPLVLVEVKLGWGPELVDQAAESLNRFASKIDSAHHPHVIKLVITGGGFSYRRPDGVQVVALPALAP